jgi:hypothetical protein
MTSTATNNAPSEIFYSNHGVSLCLIPNRRNRLMRVVDFRSGANPTKSELVARLARQEGAERVFTLVERDEVSTWSRLGFQREGSIPGFYKRSDAWVLGTSVDRLTPLGPDESGMRRAIGVVQPDAADAEKVYQSARKVAKQVEDSRPAARLHPAREADVKKALASAGRGRRALTGFENFGRDVDRLFFSCTARGGFSLMMGVEIQPCFDNAFVELLTGPRTEKEAALTRAAIGLLCDELFEREVVCCFAVSPTDDEDLAVAYLANGFRRTGLLQSHYARGDHRIDAFLWARKLALPSDG